MGKAGALDEALSSRRNYTKLVQDRNAIAHSNDNIFYSAVETIEDQINKTLKLVEEIQQLSTPVIEACYCKFLMDNNDPDDWEYADGNDQIREILIHKNYLSQKDIEICLHFDISAVDSHEGYDGIQGLHEALIEEYSESEVS